MGCKTGILLTLGTGVGGALLINGKPWRGEKNNASELGHIVTHAGGKRCPCGSRGCFEQYASATALSEMGGEYRAVIGARPARAMIVRDAQGLLAGGVNAQSAAAFARYVSDSAPTGSNTRAGAAYRSRLIRVLVERSMHELGGAQ